MKSTTLFLALFFSLLSFAQNWAPAGAKWHYTYIGFSIGYVEIAKVGDTVIAGQTCQKLQKTFNGLQFGVTPMNFVFDTTYIYESNGVVYVLEQNQWKTLYNFNAVVGEHWPMAPMPEFGGCTENSQLKVLATGTKVINAQASNIWWSTFVTQTSQVKAFKTPSSKKSVSRVLTCCHSTCAPWLLTATKAALSAATQTTTLPPTNLSTVTNVITWLGWKKIHSCIQFKFTPTQAQANFISNLSLPLKISNSPMPQAEPFTPLIYKLALTKCISLVYSQVLISFARMDSA